MISTTGLNEALLSFGSFFVSFLIFLIILDYKFLIAFALDLYFKLDIVMATEHFFFFPQKFGEKSFFKV